MPPPVLTASGITAGWVPGSPVVRQVDLSLAPATVLGLQGPSGCGKSTLARVLALLHAPEAGSITLDGERITGVRHRVPREFRIRVGIVFQSPRLAVDPRMNLRQAVVEPLLATGRQAGADARVREVAASVGLTDELLARRPHAVSDGQLQRACLARALVLRPRYLVCDEMTTMLDASTTAALVHVLEDYRRTEQAGVLAISHDRALLRQWAASIHVLDGPHRTEAA